MPTNFEGACMTIGVFFTIGNTASLIYNLLFCIVVSASMKKTLKGTLFNQKRYHLIVMVFVTGITLAIGLTNTLGTGFNGVCGYKLSNRESLSRFIL